jgi:hypothetical protein
MAISIVLESGMQHEVRSVASGDVLRREQRLASESIREVPEGAGPSLATAPNAESNLAFAPSAPSAAPPEMAEEREPRFASDAPRPAPQTSADEEAVTALADRAFDEQKAQEEAGSAIRDLSAARAQTAKRGQPTAPSAAAPAGQEAPSHSDAAAQSETLVMPKPIQTQASQREPAAWLNTIRELRDAGKDEDADREWRAFKAAYADFEVALDDVARPVEERD